MIFRHHSQIESKTIVTAYKTNHKRSDIAWRNLTHFPLTKGPPFWQRTFSLNFTKIYLLIGVQLTIRQHWFQRQAITWTNDDPFRDAYMLHYGEMSELCVVPRKVGRLLMIHKILNLQFLQIKEYPWNFHKISHSYIEIYDFDTTLNCKRFWILNIRGHTYFWNAPRCSVIGWKYRPGLKSFPSKSLNFFQFLLHRINLTR